MQFVKIYIDNVELTRENREKLLGRVKDEGLFTKSMTPMEEAIAALQYSLSDILTADGENTVITTVMGHNVRFVFVNYPDTYKKSYALRSGERIELEFRHPYGTEKEVVMAEAARDKVVRDLIARVEKDHGDLDGAAVEEIVKKQMDGAELHALFDSENASTVLEDFYSMGVQDYCREHPEVYHLSEDNSVEKYGAEIEVVQRKMENALEAESDYRNMDDLSRKLGISRTHLYRKAKLLEERLGRAPTLEEIKEEHLRTVGKRGRPKKY